MKKLSLYTSVAGTLYTDWVVSHPGQTKDDFFEFLCNPSLEREDYVSSCTGSVQQSEGIIYLSIS